MAGKHLEEKADKERLTLEGVHDGQGINTTAPIGLSVGNKQMIQLIILIVLSIALFKNVKGLRQEKDFIIADERGKGLFAQVTRLPFLYLVPFALSVVPILPLPILLALSIILYIPGILVTQKAKRVFETGCDRSFEISKKLDLLFAIGVAGLILTIAVPLLILVVGSVLLRNP